MADIWVWFAYVATYGTIIGYAISLRVRRRRLEKAG
jgi:hypothetical protein